MTDLEGRSTFALSLDVLGFKSLVEERPVHLAQVYRELARLFALIPRIKIPVEQTNLATGETTQLTLGFSRLRRPHFFSDSVFVVSTDDSAESLEEISAFANIAFRMFFQHGLPVAGAIASGQTWLYANDNVLLGSSIVKAYELSQEAKVVGVVLDEGLAPTNSAGPFQVPTKGGTRWLRVPNGDSGAATRPMAVHQPGWQSRWDGWSARAIEMPFAPRYIHGIPIVAAMMEGGAPGPP